MPMITLSLWRGTAAPPSLPSPLFATFGPANGRRRKPYAEHRQAGIPASPPAEPDAPDEPDEPEFPIKRVPPEKPDLPPDDDPPEIDDPQPDDTPFPVREPPDRPTPMARRAGLHGRA